jgi:hypothetical protein
MREMGKNTSVLYPPYKPIANTCIRGRCTNPELVTCNQSPVCYWYGRYRVFLLRRRSVTDAEIEDAGLGAADKRAMPAELVKLKTRCLTDR